MHRHHGWAGSRLPQRLARSGTRPRRADILPATARCSRTRKRARGTGTPALPHRLARDRSGQTCLLGTDSQPAPALRALPSAPGRPDAHPGAGQHPAPRLAQPRTGPRYLQRAAQRACGPAARCLSCHTRGILRARRGPACRDGYRETEDPAARRAAHLGPCGRQPLRDQSQGAPDRPPDIPLGTVCRWQRAADVVIRRGWPSAGATHHATASGYWPGRPPAR